MSSIKITCKAATSIELADLQPLQGNLKELSPAATSTFYPTSSDCAISVSSKHSAPGWSYVHPSRTTRQLAAARSKIYKTRVNKPICGEMWRNGEDESEGKAQ